MRGFCLEEVLPLRTTPAGSWLVCGIFVRRFPSALFLWGVFSLCAALLFLPHFCSFPSSGCPAQL